MPGSRGSYRGFAALTLCAGALALPAPAGAATGVSEECSTARDHVEGARDAVKNARERLRRARQHGDHSDVVRARRRLERKIDKLAERKDAEEAACAKSPPGPYVALGDSIAAYAGYLFPHYQATLGATQFLNRTRGGESSSSIRTSGQLATALADINSPSDARVVTINIGGVEALSGSCTWSEPSCPFRANFDATLDDLVAALAGDPGDEPLVAMAYHNPASGRGDSQEAQYDATLLGSDGVRSCSGTGAQLGLNDVISQEAAAHGALLADAYTAIKQGGQAYMGDSVHPNATGYAAIAEAFKAAAAPCG